MCGHLLRLLPAPLAIGLSALLGTTSSSSAAQESLAISHWKFDEQSEDIAIDSATKGHTGTIIGAVGLIPWITTSDL